MLSLGLPESKDTGRHEVWTRDGDVCFFSFHYPDRESAAPLDRYPLVCLHAHMCVESGGASGVVTFAHPE